MESYNEFSVLLATVFGDREHVAIAMTKVASNDFGDLFLGADALGRRHIMARIPAAKAVPMLQWEVLQLQEWVDPHSHSRFLDLVCTQESVAQVFGALADDVKERLSRERQEPHKLLLAALDDWRRLFRPAKEMTVEKARGLFGELTVLQMLADLNPTIAPELWLGPEGHAHDFASPHGDVEVKSSGSDGLSVVMSSLDQLDPQGPEALVLTRLRVVESPQGKTLVDLVDDLVASGVLRSALVERLEGSEFLLGVDSDDHRFIVDGPVKAWLVTEDFPGIRRSDFPPARVGAVSGVKYTLDLAAAPAPLEAEELAGHLKRMVSA